MCPCPRAAAARATPPSSSGECAAGLDAAYNPFWSLLDPSAGRDRRPLLRRGGGLLHRSVRPPGQGDRRLGQPRGDRPDAAGGHRRRRGRAALPRRARVPAASRRSPSPRSACRPTTSSRRSRTPRSLTRPPRRRESLAYTKAGVDSGEIVIRGGTHYDFDWIPNPGFPATLRGADLIDWYTSAWFDKYVKRDPTADARLLTGRWRHDAQGGAVDPNHDAQPVQLLLPLAARHRDRARPGRLRGAADRLPGAVGRRRLSRHATTGTGSSPPRTGRRPRRRSRAGRPACPPARRPPAGSAARRSAG